MIAIGVLIALSIVLIHPMLGFVLGLSFAVSCLSLHQKSAREWIFIVLTFFMPLFPDAGIEVAGRMINWFDWILIGLALRILSRPFNPIHLSRWDSIQKAAALYVLVLLLLALNSARPLISIGEWISHAVNLGLTLFVVEGLRLRGEQKLHQGLAICSILACLIAGWQKLNGYVFAATEDGESTIRVGVPGPFDDSLLLGMFAAAAGLMLLHQVLKCRHPMHRLIYMAGLLANLINLSLALTRTGIFMFLLGLSMMGLLHLLQWLKELRKAILIPVLVLSVPVLSSISLLFLPTDVQNRLLAVFSLLSRDPDPILSYSIRSTLGRLENYKHAWQTFESNPATGIGLGLYKHFTRFEDTDGFWPGLISETGLVGLTFFLLFLAVLLKRWLQMLWDSNANQRLDVQMLAGFSIAMLAGAIVEPTYKIQCLSFLYFYCWRQVERNLYGPRPGEAQ